MVVITNKKALLCIVKGGQAHKLKNFNSSDYEDEPLEEKKVIRSAPLRHDSTFPFFSIFAVRPMFLILASGDKRFTFFFLTVLSRLELDF